MASWCKEVVWVDYSEDLILKDALSAVMIRVIINELTLQGISQFIQ
jgi:hypothetical protein